MTCTFSGCGFGMESSSRVVSCPDPTHKEKDPRPALLLWVGSGHETKLAEARLTRCGVQEARSLDKMPPKMRACRFRCVSLLHEAACAF